MKDNCFDVYGERFGMDGRVLLASNVDYEHAEKTEWFSMGRYDRITIIAL